MNELYQAYLMRLTDKRRATREDLDMYLPLANGKTAIQLGDNLIILNSEDERDHLSDNEKILAQNQSAFWGDDGNTPANCVNLPDTIDHRAFQTSIKDQQDRGTCVCFASLANIESIIKRSNGNDMDLSEQYANWVFMREEGKNHCSDGLVTTASARYLSTFGVCEEADYPYEDKNTVNSHCLQVPDQAIQGRAIYGISDYALIDNLGFFGPSIRNVEYLERLLCRGFNIVFGTHVAWGRNADANNVYDVILDEFGNPLRSNGGHAMLIVGYDRTDDNGQLPYFIIKNSWDTTFGVSGYMYLSYDYITTYAKYGYIVLGISTTMSPTNF